VLRVPQNSAFLCCRRISLTVSCTDIIFDILYHEDRSLIHLPLRERHEILKKVVTPLKHRIEVLVPDAELNREPGEALFYGEFCCGIWRVQLPGRNHAVLCCRSIYVSQYSVGHACSKSVCTPSKRSVHPQISRPVKDLLGVLFWSLSRI
jgi:hypothetical protein